MCFRPIYLNGDYIQCYRCLACKSNFKKDKKKLKKKAKSLIDISDWESGQKEYAENGEPIC